MSRALPGTPRHLRWTTANYREQSLVDALHRWLDQQQLTIADLTPERLQQFLACPRGAPVSRSTTPSYRMRLRGYLQWLHEQALIDFAPAPPRRPAAELPPLAREFLASLAPTHRPRTCEGYAYALRKLHGWLAARGLELARLTRPEFAPWLQDLHAAGLCSVSRLRILIDVRSYLYWRGERERMRTAPDELIRRSDFPKLPRYLPRPLTAQADRELQHRLERSPHRGAWALLLMRRTGLRIGELRALAYHCLRSDGRYPLLKVPLGKLHTERLVPIDADTVELIQRLQSLKPRPRPWLVPGFGDAQMSLHRLRRILERHSHGLADPARITSHRLRHTYATEMLSAGVSLLGVMRLLGHRDHRMTLRYTEITPETVGDEYARALERITTKYHLPAQPPSLHPAPNPDELLDQLARLLRKHASSSRPVRALLKRIKRLRLELRSLELSTET